MGKKSVDKGDVTFYVSYSPKDKSLEIVMNAPRNEAQYEKLDMIVEKMCAGLKQKGFEVDKEHFVRLLGQNRVEYLPLKNLKGKSPSDAEDVVVDVLKGLDLTGPQKTTMISGGRHASPAEPLVPNIATRVKSGGRDVLS